MDFSEDSKQKEVSELLKELGFPRASGGFSNCRDALLLALQQEELYGSLTKVIFPEIAKKRGKSDAAVEKSVRDALSKGWNEGNRDKFRVVFGDSYRPRRGKPTVIEFLSAARDYLDQAG